MVQEIRQHDCSNWHRRQREFQGKRVTEESAAYATPKAAEASPSPLQKGRGLGRGVARCRLSRGLGSKSPINGVNSRAPHERAKPRQMPSGCWPRANSKNGCENECVRDWLAADDGNPASALLQGRARNLAAELGFPTFFFIDSIEERTGVEPDGEAVQVFGR